jgi:L-seryl-tRNA(Ser) seleniumtransferase
MLSTGPAARRALPSIDKLLNDARVDSLIGRYGRPHVIETLRARLDAERSALAEAHGSGGFDAETFLESCAAQLAHDTQPSLRPVYNLTGTVLHTNLGRALMPRCAAEAVMQAMMQPVNLEFDLDGAARGERDSHIERWLTRLTGGEAAAVVNNNAAAVYLALNTLAARKEVIVSRGELIEIGGAFRIPDIMARSGCKLREVGTTNRTHLKDYAEAIGPRTAAIMKVHTSNYAIHGFTAAVAEADLARLAHEHDLPLIVDLGSGMLVNLEEYGLPHEPTPAQTLTSGADIVTFSGDKLLGGPQAGLIVGSKDLVARIRKNPMKRALRVDKMTLAALDAVLQLYLNPARLRQELPTLRFLTRPVDEIDEQAQRVLDVLSAIVGNKAQVRVDACASQIGSGSLPVDSLPSAAIAIEGAGKNKGSAAQRIAAAFRALPVPVIGRIRDGVFLLDLRCLDDEAAFIAQLPQLELTS